MSNWCLYLIRCNDDSLYTGITKDVERRFAEHSAQGEKAAKYLRGKGPLTLVYSAAVGSHADALRIEKKVKRLSKTDKLRLIHGERQLPVAQTDQEWAKIFVNALVREKSAPKVTNFYKKNSLQAANLKRYLTTFGRLRPSVMFVGEAPGYKGCALTGIPFSSPAVLREVSFFDGKYRMTGDSTRREATAKIVWEAIRGWEVPPLCWNAFPLHPHKPDDPLSNRAPAAAELELGGLYLHKLIDRFAPSTVCAIGRRAQASLTKLEIPHRPIRHPSYGGKQAFLAGIADLSN